MKNNDGTIIFNDDTIINASQGIAITQLGDAAKLIANKDLTLSGQNSPNNTLNMQGGTFTVNGKALITSEGKGYSTSIEHLSAAIFQTGGVITFGKQLDASTDNDELGTVGNSLGDVIRIQGGTLTLGETTTLEAKQIGDGLSVAGSGTNVQLGKDTTTIIINNPNNNAIKITGGTITAEDDSWLTINKNNGSAYIIPQLCLIMKKLLIYRVVSSLIEES